MRCRTVCEALCTLQKTSSKNVRKRTRASRRDDVKCSKSRQTKQCNQRAQCKHNAVLATFSPGGKANRRRACSSLGSFAAFVAFLLAFVADDTAAAAASSSLRIKSSAPAPTSSSLDREKNMGNTSVACDLRSCPKPICEARVSIAAVVGIDASTPHTSTRTGSTPENKDMPSVVARGDATTSMISAPNKRKNSKGQDARDKRQKASRTSDSKHKCSDGVVGTTLAKCRILGVTSKARSRRVNKGGPCLLRMPACLVPSGRQPIHAHGRPFVVFASLTPSAFFLTAPAAAPAPAPACRHGGGDAE